MKRLFFIFAVFVSYVYTFAQNESFRGHLIDTTGITYHIDEYSRTAEVVALGSVMSPLAPVMGAAGMGIADKMMENKIHKTFDGDVVIPSTIAYKRTTCVVTSIGKSAFAENEKLYSITIPTSVTSIGENAFGNCKNLSAVFLSDNITVIERRAFAGCKRLRFIMLPEKIHNLGDYAFAWSGLEEVILGRVDTIGQNVFYKCKLKELTHAEGFSPAPFKIPSSVQLTTYNSTNTPYTPEKREQLAQTHGLINKPTAKKEKVVEKGNSIHTAEAPIEPSPAAKKSEVDINIPVGDISSPNTFAIIFANEDYKNVAKVPFAKNDGTIFRKYCQRTLGIPATNIRYIENASLNDIRIQLAWLEDVCEAFEGKASVIVYYAGHGIPDEKSQVAYLLPTDGDSRYITTGYKLDDLYATLGNMPASQITVFMDACFSGSKREDGMLAEARGVALKAKSGVPQGNMVVFSAAQGNETAYPNREQQHGLFTYYLLKKLQETKGNIDLKSLGDYVTKQVSQQSLLLNNKKQTPCVTPSASVGTDWQSWKLK